MRSIFLKERAAAGEDGLTASLPPSLPHSARDSSAHRSPLTVSLLLLAFTLLVLLSSSSMAAASSSGSAAAAAARVMEQLEEHAVALSNLPDAHAAVQIALHLHTLQRPGTKCVALNDQQNAGDEKNLPSIPPNWSASADGFCFQYVAPAPAGGAAAEKTRFVIKSIRMDRTLLVHGAIKTDAGAAAAAGDKQPPIRSIDINVDDFVHSAALPAGAGSASAAAPTAASSVQFSSLFKDLPSLLNLYDSGILTPLLPKAAAAATAAAVPAGDGAQKPSSIHDRPPDYDPLRVPPRGGQPRRPLEDDDPRSNPFLRDEFSRPRVGDFSGDLDPLARGPNTGNLMGPRNFPGMGGGMGGRPPGMAPRFDPYGPAPGMGEPDFDELPPPGFGGPFGPGGGPGLGGPGFGPGRGGGGRGGNGRGQQGFGGNGMGDFPSGRGF